MSAEHKTHSPVRRFAKAVQLALWDYRSTLIYLVVALIWIGLGFMLPVYLTAPIWAAATGAIGYWRKPIFDYLSGRLYGERVAREVQRASVDSGFGRLIIEDVKTTLPGELVSIRVPRGKTVSTLERQIESVSGCLRAPVRIRRDREDPSQADLSITRRNPFLSMSEMEWPLLNAASVDIRQGIPFGRDEFGHIVNARLLSRNLILGGSPDAGKSTALRILAAAGALDPKVKLWMMDAKQGATEFIHWNLAAEDLVKGRDLEAAVEMLTKLEQRVADRYDAIVARGEVFVCDDMELDLLIIDELPQYTRGFENDSKAEAALVKTIRGGIWKLIAMGRAAGMITVLSALKPTADIVPSESRDLIDHKFALHCNTKAMSDTILGAGAGEEAPANAADIPSGQPGVGYYVGDNGVQKMRNFFISHKQALDIATRAGSRNLDADLEALK